MNKNHICIFDFECGSIDPTKCQITEIAAIVINPRSLKVEANGVFNSDVQPILDDEKAIAAGLDPVSDQALEITRKTRDQLAKAPNEKVVFHKFTQFIKQFNPKNNAYTAPIPCGFNITNYDMVIIERLCQKYGPLYKGKQSIFNQLYQFDLMNYFMFVSENNPAIEKRRLSDFMDFMGMPAELKEQTHNGLHDVKCTANILIKLLHFQREIGLKNDYSKAFASGKLFIE